MYNLSAQTDALAYYKFKEELIGQELNSHMTFKGDKPSLSIMFKELNAYAVGTQ